MVHSCCIVGCTRRQSKDLRIQLHRLPALPESRREAWIRAIRRNTVDGTRPWTPTSSSRVCGHHFIEGMHAYSLAYSIGRGLLMVLFHAECCDSFVNVHVQHR